MKKTTTMPIPMTRKNRQATIGTPRPAPRSAAGCLQSWFSSCRRRQKLQLGQNDITKAENAAYRSKETETSSRRCSFRFLTFASDAKMADDRSAPSWPSPDSSRTPEHKAGFGLISNPLRGLELVETGASGGEIEIDDGREVVLAAVRENGHALQHASAWCRSDRVIVAAAIKSRRHGGPGALRFASPELQADPELLALADAQHQVAQITASTEDNDGRGPEQLAGDVHGDERGEQWLDVVHYDRSPLGLKFTCRGAIVLARRPETQGGSRTMSAVRPGDRLIMLNGAYVGTEILSSDLAAALQNAPLPLTVRFWRKTAFSSPALPPQPVATARVEGATSAPRPSPPATATAENPRHGSRRPRRPSMFVSVSTMATLRCKSWLFDSLFFLAVATLNIVILHFVARGVADPMVGDLQACDSWRKLIAGEAWWAISRERMILYVAIAWSMAARIILSKKHDSGSRRFWRACALKSKHLGHRRVPLAVLTVGLVVVIGMTAGIAEQPPEQKTAEQRIKIPRGRPGFECRRADDTELSNSGALAQLCRNHLGAGGGVSTRLPFVARGGPAETNYSYPSLPPQSQLTTAVHPSDEELTCYELGGFWPPRVGDAVEVWKDQHQGTHGMVVSLSDASKYPYTVRLADGSTIQDVDSGALSIPPEARRAYALEPSPELLMTSAQTIPWLSHEKLAAILETWHTSLESGLMKAQFTNQRQAHENYKMFENKACGTRWLVEAACSVLLPVCRHDDCQPMTSASSCTRIQVENFASCANMTLRELQGEFDRFRANVIQQSWFRRLLTKEQGCAIQYMFKAFGFQLDKQWAPKYCRSCDPISTNDADNATNEGSGRSPDAQNDITCDPDSPDTRVAKTFRLEVDENAKARLFTILLLSTLGVTLASLALTRSSQSEAERLFHRLRRVVRGTKSSLLVGLIALSTAIITFAGGIQSELAPQGVPNPGESEDCVRVDTLLPPQVYSPPFNPWAAIYFLTTWACLTHGFWVAFTKRHTRTLVHSPSSASVDEPKPRAAQLSKKRSSGVATRAQAWATKAKDKYTFFFGIQRGHIGPYYVPKLLVSEVFEVGFQLATLFATRESQERDVVVFTFVIIGLNLLSLPVTSWFAMRFLRPTQAALVIMVMEILFDKGFTIVGVFLRAPSQDALTGFGDQLVFHGAVVFSSFMTLLTLDDARELISIHVSRLEATRASSDSVASHPRQYYASTTRSKNLGRLGGVSAVLTVLLGVALIALQGVVTSECDEYWAQTLGDAAQCSRPRYFFADVGVSDRRCGLSRVTAIRCGLKLQSGGTANPGNVPQIKYLPDSPNYAEAISLKSVDLSGQLSLREIPVAWHVLPNLTQVSLRQSGAMHLPWEICSTNKTKIPMNVTYDFRDTELARNLSWVHVQPPLAGPDDISSACIQALKDSLELLDVSNNAFSAWRSLADVSNSFRNLKSLRFAGNEGLHYRVSEPTNLVLMESPETTPHWNGLPSIEELGGDSSCSQYSAHEGQCPAALHIQSGASIDQKPGNVPVLPFRSIMNQTDEETSKLPWLDSHFPLCPLPDLIHSPVQFLILDSVLQKPISDQETRNWLRCLPTSLREYSIDHVSFADPSLVNFSHLALLSDLRRYRYKMPLDDATGGSFPNGTFENMQHLFSLEFKYGTQNKEIPNQIPVAQSDGGGLASLQWLDLHTMNFQRGSTESSTFEAGIFRGYKNLRILKIENSPLPRIEDGAFDGLQDSLEYLKLDHCSVKRLPRDLGALTRLQIIDISGNEITELPSSMSRLTKLHTLDASFNQIENLTPGLFSGMDSLVRLHLGANKLRGVPEDLLKTSSSRSRKNLIKLNLEWNLITEIPDKLLVGQGSLRDVYLNLNRISNFPGPALAPVRDTLQTMKIYGNAFTVAPRGTLAGFTKLYDIETSALVHMDAFFEVPHLRLL